MAGDGGRGARLLGENVVAGDGGRGAWLVGVKFRAWRRRTRSAAVR